MTDTAPSANVHDIGGSLGWGVVPYIRDEAPFHYDWERRVFGMLFQVLSRTAQRPGEFRYALERLSDEDYFCLDGYYGRWRAAIELLLEEYGHLEAGELDTRLGLPLGNGVSNRAAKVAEVLEQNMPPDRVAPRPSHRTVRRELETPSRFKIGDVVVAVGITGSAHTRVPQYVRGVSGQVVNIHPVEVLPDSTAFDLGDRPQHVICVAYRAEDLWGRGSEEGVIINVDLYECYLRFGKEMP